MKRLKIIVEGKTEEQFIIETLTDYLGEKGISVTPIILPTSFKNGLKYKGGFRRTNGYDYAAKYIAMMIKQDPDAVYSTMLDFYGFPQDVGCLETINSIVDIYEKANYLELFIYNDIKKRIGFEPRFIPYIEMHEFEAVLFVNPLAYEGYEVNNEQIKAIIKEKEGYATPEHINNSPDTAPSKRLRKLIEGYETKKAYLGPIFASFIGVDNIRGECKHFNNWLCKIESI